MHIWDPTVLEYSWLEGELIAPTFRPSSGRGAGRHRCHIRRGGSRGQGGRGGLGRVSRLAGLLGVVAHAPLEEGRGVVAELAALREAGRTVGIRRLLQDEPLSFFEDPGLLEGLRALASAGLPFVACIRHHQLAALTALLARVPELPVVLDHLAKPPVATGDDGTWERDLRALAAMPQVSVKPSGMRPELRDDQEPARRKERSCDRVHRP